MYGLKFLINRMKRDKVCRSFSYIASPQQTRTVQSIQERTFATRRVISKPVTNEIPDDECTWPRKIFSGIQPTGGMHLGNYLGAVKKWKELQEAQEDVTYCIVDMHSITVPQDPAILRENIFKLAATMLACGIDPNRSTVFVQSAVKEHSELCWMLGTVCTMARLGHLPQYKDKTRQLKEIPLGLFVYPILQAADIMLYKSTHVPVGEDQVQHIQLTQHLAKVFNSRFGQTFPICHAIIENKQTSRIRSLRDPSKKMSKSDPDPKSAIYIDDEPDVVVEKVKKAVTDFCSDVSYDAEGRPGVSNLIAIHSHVSGQSIEQIVNEARTLDTGKYKLRVAEAINEHLDPIRKGIKEHLDNRAGLIGILEVGADKARNIAYDTLEEVKHRMGLGAPYLPLYVDSWKVSSQGSSSSGAGEAGEQKQSNATIGGITATTKHILEAKLSTLEVSRKLSAVRKPEVPQQRLRIEKIRDTRRVPSSTAGGKPINIISDITKGLLSKGLLDKGEPAPSARTKEYERLARKMRESQQVRRVARCIEIKTPQTIITPITAASATTSTTSSAATSTPTSKSPSKSASVPASAQKTSSKYGMSKSNLSTLSSKSQTSSVLSKKSMPTPMPREWQRNNTRSSNNNNNNKNNNNNNTNNNYNGSELSKRTSYIRIKKKATPTATALIMTSLKVSEAHQTRRYFTTSPIESTSRKNVPPPPPSPPKKQRYSNEHIEKLIFCGVLAIGVGFFGVYYFCRSILKAYFDSKKNGGG